MKLKSILEKLVTFKTYEGNPSKVQEVANFYNYVIAHTPKKYKIKRVINDRSESLLIYSKSLKKPKVVLQSHIDVVPGNDSLFIPVTKQNKLIGRGVSDMKFAVACYIKLLDDLKDVDLDMAVWLTCDEEIGGTNGIKYLLNSYHGACEFCFLPDGVNEWGIVDKAKGVLHFSLKAYGKSAHGSQPWLGNNAIDEIIKAYQDIKLNIIFKKTFTEDCWFNTINLGKIVGGEATNSVAQYAEAFFDIRFINAESYRRIISLIKKTVSKYHLEFKEVIVGPSYKVNRESFFIKELDKQINYHKIVSQYKVDHGSSDARYFIKEGIPVVLFKPICGGDHSENEWIDLDSLEIYYSILKKWLMNTAI